MSHHKKHHHEADNAGAEAVKPNDVSETKPGEAGESKAGEKSAASEVEKQCEQLKNQLLRVSADYQNYQRRMNRELDQTRQMVQESMVRSLLTVLDNFELTLSHADQVQDVKTMAEGVRMIYQHLTAALGGVGLKKIAVKPGDMFDHNIHEAVMHEPTTAVAENTVARELASGYTMNERTLRPTKVSIAKGVPAPAADQDTSGGDNAQ